MCQNYGWSLKDAMGLTLPQVFMMNHAAGVNSARMDERIARDKTYPQPLPPGTSATARDDRDPILVQYGKRLSECTSEEIAAQFRGM